MGNFIVFILVLFVLAALLRIDFFFTILYLFVGVYILSRFWLRRSLTQLHVTRKLEQRAFLGDRIPVTVTLKNLRRLPIPWLVITETYPVTLASPPILRQVITLGGKAIHTIQYTLTASKRGYYQIGPLSLTTGDLLGIIGELSGRYEADHLIVYPKIVPIRQVGLPTHSPQVILPTPVPLFQDPARLIGVREYVSGDNPRHIHWTASASAGELLVKQFQPAIARENAIFLNLSRPDYARRGGYPGSAIELAITVAASLVNHMIAVEQLPVGLFTTATDPLTETTQKFRLPPHKGRSHLMQILEVLARVQEIEKVTDFLVDIRREAVDLSWGATTVVITSLLSEELYKTLLFLRHSGFQPGLVLINPPRKRVEAREELPHQLGIPIFEIKQEKDIERWLPAL
jgi:uncharacterized protein (DUF58 family)